MPDRKVGARRERSKRSKRSKRPGHGEAKLCSKSSRHFVIRSAPFPLFVLSRRSRAESGRQLSAINFFQANKQREGRCIDGSSAEINWRWLLGQLCQTRRAELYASSRVARCASRLLPRNLPRTSAASRSSSGSDDQTTRKRDTRTIQTSANRGEPSRNSGKIYRNRNPVCQRQIRICRTRTSSVKDRNEFTLNRDGTRNRLQLADRRLLSRGYF